MSSVSSVNGDDRVNVILETISFLPNRETLRRYLEERKALGIKASTLANDANILRDWAVHLGQKRFDEAAKEDVVAFVNARARQRVWRSRAKGSGDTVTKRTVHLGEGTMSVRRIILKCFQRWVRQTDEYPPEVRWLKAAKPSGDFIPTDALLTPDEVRRMLQALPDPREKALIAVLYESGMRAGEICALNVGSIVFDDHGAVATIPKKGTGLKTGARVVRLLPGGVGGSVPYLLAWWENHPRKQERGAPLYYSNSHRAPGARFTPNALHRLVKTTAAAAGTQKNVHPHLFRHTAATERAREGWTEYDMRAFFGWSRSSNMPSHYVHLAGKDYEDRLLERKGLKVRGDASKGALMPRGCRMCRSENLPTATFCQNCRHPVSPEAERELERRRQRDISEVVSRMLYDFGRHMGAGGQLFTVPSVDPVKGLSGAEMETRSDPARTPEEAIARVQKRRARDAR